MKIDKSQIIDLLRSQGRDDQIGAAERELPDQVDTDQDRNILERFGLDIGDLSSKLGSGGLGKLLG